MLFNVYGAENTNRPIQELDPPNNNVDFRSIVAFSGMGMSLNCAKLGEPPLTPSAVERYMASLWTQLDRTAANIKKIKENNKNSVNCSLGDCGID